MTPRLYRFEVLTVDRGVWCDLCSLPGATTIWFTLASDTGMTLRCVTGCDCQEAA